MYVDINFDCLFLWHQQAVARDSLFKMTARYTSQSRPSTSPQLELSCYIHTYACIDIICIYAWYTYISGTHA